MLFTINKILLSWEIKFKHKLKEMQEQKQYNQYKTPKRSRKEHWRKVSIEESMVMLIIN